MALAKESSDTVPEASSSFTKKLKQKLWEKTTAKAKRFANKVSSVKARLSEKTKANRFGAKKKPSTTSSTLTDDASSVVETVAQSGAVASSASSEGDIPTKKRVQAVLPPRKEKKLAAKYAQIECLEEKAFTILQDLGMVETTLDFSI
eukprot:scaffold8011_cov149-Amphora_coffeaeformis.AAC.2